MEVDVQKVSARERVLMAMEKFCEKNWAVMELFKFGSGSVMFIDLIPGKRVDTGVLARVSQVSAYWEGKETTRNCYLLAIWAVDRSVADGLLYTNWGAEDFTGYGNHWISYWNLGAEGVLAIDMTARKNMDYDKGEFGTLVLRAPTMEELLIYLDKLYGGQWEVRARFK